MSDTAVLETHDLTKRFGALLAVDRINLHLGAGCVHGLLGRNGAGKTTLMRLILGLLAPDSGTVTLFGEPAAPGDVEARARVAGFVEEPRFYPYLSARRNLELLARLDGATATITPDEALELVDLGGRRREKAGNFSTGMRQRLGIAAALLRSAQLIVLDEPTIGLDPANSRTVRGLVRDLAANGTSVLLSSHNMAEVAEICDRVTIIHGGSAVWQGDQAQLQAAAPAPTYRVWTSDDETAAAVARHRGLLGDARAGIPALIVRGTEAERDDYVVELARAGVAVRRLEPDVPPLESLFTTLTGSATDDEEAAA